MCQKKEGIDRSPKRNSVDEQVDVHLPKAVPALRTRSSYCQFFNGISKARMIRLLEKAYEETEDEEERTAKVEKRVLILDGCFA